MSATNMGDAEEEGWGGAEGGGEVFERVCLVYLECVSMSLERFVTNVLCRDMALVDEENGRVRSYLAEDLFCVIAREFDLGQL